MDEDYTLFASINYMSSCLLRNQSLESDNDSLDVFRGRIKQLQDAFTLSTSFIEGYRRNNLVIHLHLSGGDGSRDLCIVMNDGEADIYREMSPEVGKVRSSQDEVALQAREKYPPVFVDIREFIQDEKGVLLRNVPVFARLQSLDLCDKLRVTNSAEPLFIGLHVECRVGCADGKRISLAGLATRSNHHFPYKIIESGPEILNAVPNDKRNIGWDGMSHLNIHDGAIDIAVCIQHAIVGAVLNVPIDFGFERLEMVLCSRQLVAH